MLRTVVALALAGLLLAPARASAQPTQKLFSQSTSGAITSNGGTVEMQNAGGLGSLKVQTSTTYAGTWEVQCSVAPTGITPVYDTDDEVNLSLEGATGSPVQAVTDTLGIWTASIAGCTSVRVITTAWTSGTLTVYLYATTTGGGSSSGGGSGGGEVTNAGTFAVQCTSGCGGSGGVSSADDADFVDGTTDLSLVGAVAESASPTTVTEGDSGAFAMTLNRALKTSLYNASGTTAFGTAGTAATPVLTVQGIAAMTPILATVTATDLDIQSGGADVLSTTAFNAALGTAGSADAQVRSIQGIASMTPVQVTNPTAASATSYITARLSDGSNFLTAATDVTEDVAETAGGTGPMAMTVRRDVAASSAGTTGDNATSNTDALGQMWTRQLDPCSGVAKTFIAISISSATTTELTSALAGASTNYYVCSLNLVTAAANNVALVDDDTDNCASVTTGLAGGTTAATGWNFAANGGMTFGSGASSIFKTAGTNRVLCLVTSAATQLSGSIVVVAAP